ncbi:MAG: PspC domain-containing protein [bacterium]
MNSEPKRLFRARKGRVWLGLMAGLGKYFGIDPVILRFGAVLLLFLSAAGLAVPVLYIVFSLLVPYEPKD